MPSALIIYGTTTGNTEEMASMIERSLKSEGIAPEIKNVLDTKVGELSDKHEVVLMGCPAYGDDTIELQEDFEEFYEKMNGSLEGRKFAVFAPGDSSYEHFCGSVDMLEEKVRQLGGNVVVDGLKVDGDPTDFQAEISDWAKSIASRMG